MSTDNESFRSINGWFPIETGPDKKSLVEAFFTRQHIFFRLGFDEYVPKVHVNVECVEYISTASSTAFRLRGHLRGYVHKKISAEYDTLGRKGNILFEK